ncbi:hypothetical protein HAX54_004156, partial [Datura stramonium]|nr:hypothetical protein [Datura stramonium]
MRIKYRQANKNDDVVADGEKTDDEEEIEVEKWAHTPLLKCKKVLVNTDENGMVQLVKKLDAQQWTQCETTVTDFYVNVFNRGNCLHRGFARATCKPLQ